MKDYLEDEVDEKYYINNEKVQKLIDTLIENDTLAQPQQGKIGYIEKGTGEHQTNQVFGKDGLSPCIDACQYKQPYKVCVDLSANEPGEKV